MANIKVSEMTEATQFNNSDYVMILQTNSNKRISKTNMLNGYAKEANVETSINNVAGRILWTNSSPTSAFSAQTVTLSSSDYDMYEIIFRTNLDDAEPKINSTGRLLKGYGTRLFMAFAGSSAPGANVYSRWVTYVSDTQLDIATGYWAYGSTNRTENTRLIIPLYIIGYKTGLFN